MLTILMAVGLSLLLLIVAFLSTGVTKDFAFAFGGKIGLGLTKDDEQTFVTNPSDIAVELKCERIENTQQYLYKITIKDAKLQSEGKDDIRPVLYFKSRIRKATSGTKLNPQGIIPKEEVKTGNLGDLNFELPTVSQPTFTKESYTLFLLKKTDKCENAITGPITEDILVSQCSRALLAKFDATTNSCTREDLPYIKIERIERRIEKGISECRPVFKVINNDPFNWMPVNPLLGPGHKLIIRNCETQAREIKDFQDRSGIKDVILPDRPGGHLQLSGGSSQNSGPPDNLMKSEERDDIFCKSGGDEKKIEVYKDCFDDIGQKEKFCTKLYRPDILPGLPKPVLIQSVPFTC